MEPVSLIVGAAILLFGAILGRTVWAPSAARRALDQAAARPQPAPDTYCGCQHELSMHDPATNRCHDTERKQRFDKESGRTLGYYDVQCTCRQYTGARPIDQVFLPPTFQAGER